MTNYYVTFSSDGVQEQARLGLDTSSTETWYDTGLTDITNKQFKLENGQAVVLTEAEIAEKLLGLKYVSAVRSLKDQRATLLYACDWTQSADAPLSQEQKQAWAEYRQALRDLPDSVGADGSYTLPTAPEANFNNRILGIL